VSVLLDETLGRIRPADAEARAAALQALDAKTKPRGSLGRLEELAATVAAIRRTPAPGRLQAAVVVAAGDHGVAVEGVSAYPPEVTRQMLANFESGGAAVCVLARAAGAKLVVVDAGVGAPTANIAQGPAMTAGAAVRCIERGIECADELDREQVGVVALGEMGIANSTVAAALAAALLDADPAAVCGRGTGVDDAGLARKVGVVRSALAANAGARGDPVAALAALGGFELAVLCGVALGAAANGAVVVLDGFISSTAALVAARLSPAAAHAMIAAHLSPEPGHALVLGTLGLEPLLDLRLRLGEGSGAVLALPLIDASLAVLGEMATFAAAGVTDAGR
jgi:nicotinate-nucleotide--dimethylbenzimidazole phosphoribosyltransferase